MKINPVFVFSILVIAIASCKKDNPEPIPSPTEPTFELPNKPGSQFVYQWFKISYEGIETPLNTYDTIKVLGDTSINGQDYIVISSMIMGSDYTSEFVRLENGNVINHESSIKFSFTDFTTQFNYTEDAGFEYYTKMFSNSSQIQVPAGTFNTIEGRTFYRHPEGQAINLCGDLETTTSAYFSSGIGEIKRSVLLYGEFTQECSRRERRLISFFIPE